jgi:hypothetical protein
MVQPELYLKLFFGDIIDEIATPLTLSQVCSDRSPALGINNVLGALLPVWVLLRNNVQLSTVYKGVF